MLNIICIVALVAAAAGLVRATLWARRRHGAAARWAGTGAGAVLTAVVAAVAAVMTAGEYQLHSRSAPVPDLTVAGTADQIARGRAIVSSFCADCHSSSGPLTGGDDIGAKLPIPIGSFTSSNLTPAGALKQWSDGEIFRAIRNSVAAGGNRLLVMSLTNAGNLSDDDIRSVIAYLRTTPAAGAPTPEPPDAMTPLGVAMLGAGLLPDARPVSTAVIIAPGKQATAEYGRYIVSYQDCRQCHGKDLTGGRGGIAPVGPDLTVVKNWTRAEFITAMRTGTDPDGRVLNEEMPWRLIGTMDDVELGAVHEYLVHQPGAPASVADRAGVTR